MSVANAGSPRRADARRNYDTLFRAAQDVVARDGTDFVFEEVAAAAGVGKGTLYRHFPTRDHLLAALLAIEFETLAEAAHDLLDRKVAPWTAYVEWLELFDRRPSAYRGLQARLAAAMQDDASAIAEACMPLKAAFGDILRRAQNDAGVHAGLRAPDLLAVVASLPEGLRIAGEPHPYLSIVIEGTRR